MHSILTHIHYSSFFKTEKTKITFVTDETLTGCLRVDTLDDNLVAYPLDCRRSAAKNADPPLTLGLGVGLKPQDTAAAIRESRDAVT